MTGQTISIPFCGHCLHAVLIPHLASTLRGCVFCLHGGGLVFGVSNDLPARYVRMFGEAGYDLIQLDYPLAPESRLPEILEAVHTSVSFFLTHPKTAGYGSLPPYFLFGRSAGAYLALSEAGRLCRKSTASVNVSVAPPAGLLCFYGYRSFLIPEFSRPNTFYKKMAAVTRETAAALIGQKFLTEGPLSTRYAIYVYARQTGTWPTLLGTPEELAGCTLTDADLALLPPGFFTASSGDQDVPFRESKQLAAHIPGSLFHPVWFLEHDFDRDPSRPEGPEAYRAAIAWMEKRLVQAQLIQTR